MTQEIEQQKELKDLSKECQKAVKQFKAFLKKHVKKDFSNIDVDITSLDYEDSRLALSCVLKGGLQKDIKVLYTIHFADYENRPHQIFDSFCIVNSVTAEEQKIAIELMEKVNWFYLPKIKISIQNRRK